MSSTIGLEYAPHIDFILAARLDQAGRATGIPLAQLELIGQDEATIHAFLNAIDDGEVASFLDVVDWDHLEGAMREHTRPVSIIG